MRSPSERRKVGCIIRDPGGQTSSYERRGCGKEQAWRAPGLGDLHPRMASATNLIRYFGRRLYRVRWLCSRLARISVAPSISCRLLSFRSPRRPRPNAATHSSRLQSCSCAWRSSVSRRSGCGSRFALWRRRSLFAAPASALFALVRCVSRDRSWTGECLPRA